MNDIMAPDFATAGLAMAVAVIYATWQEFAANNMRDAKLLATIGGTILVGSGAAWLV